MRISVLFVTLAGLVVGGDVWAKDKIKGPSLAQGKANVTVEAPAAPVKPVVVVKASPAKDPLVSVTIGAPERDVIRSYVRTRVEAPKGKKAKGLPPGLAKKVAAGGELPPGWQKKCVRGEILPIEVHKHCRPLPAEIVVKLPAPPAGTILVAIDGKVVRLAKATREILDVFDVH
jgi:hypothetical protein